MATQPAQAFKYLFDAPQSILPHRQRSEVIRRLFANGGIQAKVLQPKRRSILSAQAARC
jgi:hypothetical protein